MADQRRPRTSSGVDAKTTFRPGTCTNQASSCCACCAPGDQPAPPCVRIVSGTLTWPPDIVRCFAAWLTSCSIESVRKSSYMISTTGRIPCIAAPIPLPTIAISEIGVLRTRCGPNSSRSPCVTAIEPPISAMSSPMRNTLSSSRRARASASRTASRYVVSGIHVLERVLGLRVGPRLGELDGGLDLARDLGVERLEVLVRELEPCAEELDRVLRVALALELLLVAIDLRIADVVAGQPVRPQMQENRPLAGECVLAGGQGRQMHGLDVLPVRLDQLHAVRLRPLTELIGGERRVLPDRRRFRPGVVLEDEDRRHLPELGEVQGLVERPRVRRPVAEEDDCDALLVSELEGERGADDPGHATRDDRVRAQIADLEVVQVHRAAIAVRAALELPVELGHDRIHMRSLRDRVPVRAMRGRDHVLALEGGADARGDRLLADRDVQEPRKLARPKALLDLLLEAADQEHLAGEHAQHLLRDAPAPRSRPLLYGRHGPAIMAILVVPPFVGPPPRVRNGREAEARRLPAGRTSPAAALAATRRRRFGRRRDRSRTRDRLAKPCAPALRAATEACRPRYTRSQSTRARSFGSRESWPRSRCARRSPRSARAPCCSPPAAYSRSSRSASCSRPLPRRSRPSSPPGSRSSSSAAASRSWRPCCSRSASRSFVAVCRPSPSRRSRRRS